MNDGKEIGDENQLSLENSLAISSNFEDVHNFHPAMQLLGIYVRETLTQMPKNICTRIIIATLFYNSEKLETTEYPQIYLLSAIYVLGTIPNIGNIVVDISKVVAEKLNLGIKVIDTSRSLHSNGKRETVSK